MFRIFLRLGTALSLAVIATALVFWWRNNTATERQVAALQMQKHELEQVVTRLNTEARVADVIVMEQKTENERTKTQLLFVEYDRAGKPMAPREFWVAGKQVHVDAEVIEFEQDYVMKGDPLRGHAIALFTPRLRRPAVTRQRLSDRHARRYPEILSRQRKAPTSAFEAGLWKQFWTLESDTDAQQKSGVKVAVGKGVWGPFEPGKLYTITLGSDGNLSRRVEPIRGVYGAYIEMLRKNAGG